MTSLDELLRVSAIDWDTYGRAVRDAHELLESSAPSTKEIGDARAINTRYMSASGLAMGGQRNDSNAKLQVQIDELRKVNVNLQRLITEGGLG